MSKKIVLYQPQQVDRKIGPPVSHDMLPLEMLTISAFPARDGYEIVIVDANLYGEAEGPRRMLEACEGDADQMPEPPCSSPTWIPHSLVSGSSHHQRPARESSPSWMARLQGAQPTEG